MKAQIYKIILAEDTGHIHQYPIIHSIVRGKYAVDIDELPKDVTDFLCIMKENSEVYRVKAAMSDIIQNFQKDEWYGPISISGGKQVRGGQLRFTLRYTPSPLSIDNLPEIDLPGMDGSHWGVSDWYPDVEKAIDNALKSGKDFKTRWYASKKEIVSGRISRIGKTLILEASCSDDFDTEGCGRVEIPFTTNLEKIKDALDEAWEEAEKEREDNFPVVMWKIIEGNSWIETYIKPKSFAWWHEDGIGDPPGDEYHEWGFQGDTELRVAIKEQIEDGIETGESPFYIDNYKIERVE